MKNILLIMKYPLHVPYTLKQKFKGQIDALIKMGYNVWYITFDSDQVYLNGPKGREVIKKTLAGHYTHYIHTFAFMDLYIAAIKSLNIQKFDLIYFRKSPLLFIGQHMCSKIKKAGSKLIVEIPTYPDDRAKSKNILRAVFTLLSNCVWKNCNKYVDLFAVIGESTDSYQNCPAINIENGVEVDNVPLKKDTNKDNKIHLLALASMSVWHGYDRLIKGLAEYTGERKNDIIIDMVGNEGDGSLSKWKELTHTLALDNQVIFHGRLEGKELTDLFNQATLGVASLGMFRVGFSSGSILKLREYMARGLPFIYAADDISIDSKKKWYLKVSNDETPILMENVVKFIEIINKNTSKEMRNYAKRNMTWNIQFEKIFTKLNKIPS